MSEEDEYVEVAEEGPFDVSEDEEQHSTTAQDEGYTSDRIVIKEEDYAHQDEDNGTNTSNTSIIDDDIVVKEEESPHRDEELVIDMEQEEDEEEEDEDEDEGNNHHAARNLHGMCLLPLSLFLCTTISNWLTFTRQWSNCY